MNAFHVIFLLTGGAIGIFIGLFAVSSIHERRPRAVAISLTVLVVFGVVWFGVYAAFSLSDHMLAIPLLMIVTLAVLFFAPIGGRRSVRTGEVNTRVDERDTIFAREEYRPGTDKYGTYYFIRPEHKAIDDRLRELPELLEPGGRYYDPARSQYIKSIFGVIAEMTARVDGEVSSMRIKADPAVMTSRLKELVRRLGADDVGIATLNPMYVYSHVGRGPEKWGQPIENRHRYAIVFCLEMDYGRVQAAPALPATEESALQYLRAAQISVSLARYIRSLGFPARAHISDSNYQIMLPPVAYDAGLGELGRLGYLISPRFGARIRLGAVTTDLPLLPDQPISFGVQDFCARCLKCAAICPPGAIPEGDKIDVRGVAKWQLNAEKCVHYWRVIGTDCGLCMKICPFSHPPTLVHNLIRSGIRHSSFARRVSLWGDDLFYGRPG